MKVTARYTPRLILLLLTGFVSLSTAASALERPHRLTATYEAGRDQLVVRWDQVSTADSYSVIIRGLTGEVIAKGSSRTLVKKFPGSKFVPAVEYRVQVRAVGGDATSKTASKKYIHTLTRAAGKGKLLTTNAFERSGNYYLPQNFEKKPRPLLVGFHGQGGAGDSIVNAFANFAEKHGFIIVAPSSGLVLEDIPAWEIELSGAPTADFNHIKACIDELRSFTGVKIDPARVLAVGYSAGGAVAPYYATNSANSEFTHFGVLHGGVVFDTFGPRVIPAWLSTGTTDPLRPPAELQGYKTALEALGFAAIYTQYNTDHGLTKSELRGVIEWWLDK